MKPTLVFATANENKVKEVRKLLDGLFEVKSLIDIGCSEDIPETSNTLEGNAKQKADYVKAKYGFDCFADDPHYHYVLPDKPYQRFVPFDVAANGDPLTWAMSCLRSRLVPMLREAGGTKSAEMIDAAVVAGVLDSVEQTARSIVSSPN